ncbi:hypothetical protein GCM10023149_07280 [Mucilaginibacter gynuensis]|uniref:EthD domain-containing protein n=1 Tax=Mucilaginibacter gynuensis TaxID=1302236 RepID=A0ABP8FVW1_9SPHI
MKKKILLSVLFILLAWNFKGFAQTAPVQSAPITIENYYKIKWGHAEEFITLWKKNHYPLLKKLQEKGDVISIKAEAPILHSSEDSRWDFKVTLTFKTEHLAFDYSIVDPFKKQLYPDQDSYKKEEQQRFELVLAHWDVPVESIPLK